MDVEKRDARTMLLFFCQKAYRGGTINKERNEYEKEQAYIHTSDDHKNGNRRASFPARPCMASFQPC
jgi:hypothetical protein